MESNSTPGTTFTPQTSGGGGNDPKPDPKPDNKDEKDSKPDHKPASSGSMNNSISPFNPGHAKDRDKDSGDSDSPSKTEPKPQSSTVAPPKPETSSKMAGPEAPKQDSSTSNGASAAPTPPTPPPPTPPQSTSTGVTLDDSDDYDGPKAYLVKYFLYLVMTGTLIGLVLSFFSSIVHSIGEDTSAVSGWGAGFAYNSSLVSLSTAIVFVIGLILVSRQCRKTEDAVPEIKTNSWRKGFLGVFLILVGISALSAATAMVYHLVSLAAGAGVVNIDMTETAKSIVTSLVSTLLLVATLILYSQDYRKSTMNRRMEQVHHWALVGSAVVLGVLFMMMPLKAQRDSFIDSIASSDIRTLERAIDGHARENNELPSNLRTLGISEDIEGRLNNYEYNQDDDGRTYELCAEFRTDTTEEGSSGNPLEEAISNAGLTYDPTPSANPDVHEEGRQCFEYVASSIRTELEFGSDYQDFLDSFEQQSSSPSQVH